MALIFITTCNHFVFFPLQVKNERINKEIKEPGAMSTRRFPLLKFLRLMADVKTANIR